MQQSLGLTTTKFSHAHKDVVFTPPEIARAIVAHFKPSGKMLDPCKGDGVFLDFMNGADYCEIQEGIDFFEYEKKVDWIISNPPYSVYSEWLRHSFKIAENIVYLIPINKAFNSSKMLRETYEFGGIAEIIHLGSGSSAIAAHYFGVTEFVGTELDEDYYKACCERFENATAQEALF